MSGLAVEACKIIHLHVEHLRPFRRFRCMFFDIVVGFCEVVWRCESLVLCLLWAIPRKYLAVVRCLLRECYCVLGGIPASVEGGRKQGRTMGCLSGPCRTRPDCGLIIPRCLAVRVFLSSYSGAIACVQFDLRRRGVKRRVGCMAPRGGGRSPEKSSFASRRRWTAVEASWNRRTRPWVQRNKAKDVFQLWTARVSAAAASPRLLRSKEDGGVQRVPVSRIIVSMRT